MPSLREILDDPNYVNANPATKAAIFDRWSTKDKNYTSANDATKAAIRERFGIGGIQAAEPKAQQPEEDSSDLVRGFTSYLPQMQETVGGVQVLAGKAFGSEEMIKSGVERMNAAKAELATKHKATDSFTTALNKGVGTVLTDWLPYQVGSGAANLVESLGVMLAGSAVGSMIAPGLGTLGGGATGIVEKELLKRGIKEAAEKIAKEQGENAAKEYFEAQTKAVVKDIAKKAAATTALGAQAGVHGAGEVTSRAVEEAERVGKSAADIEMERVLPAALVHGVAEYFGDKIGLGAWKNINQDAKTGLLNLAGSLVKNTAVTGTKEAPVEVIQSAAERFGAKLSLADAEAVKEYVDSAAAAYAMSIVPAAGGTARGYAEAMNKEDIQRAQDYMKQQEAAQLSAKASEEAAQITQTAVPDETGVVPAATVQSDIQFAQLQPGAIGAAAPATTTAAPAATTPAPTTPTGLTDDVILDAYAANDVSTEKTRKALEPQLVEMGLDTKAKQTEFLTAKRDELGVPAFDRKDTIGSKRAKEQFKIGRDTQRKLREIGDVTELTGTDTTAVKPSVDGAPSGVGVPTGGAEALGAAGVGDAGGLAPQSSAAEGKQPTTLEGAPSVTQTTEAKQAEAQGQKQATPAPIDQEVLRLAYENQAKEAASLGFDLPSWDQLSEAERVALAEEVQAERATKGMLPSKGEAKVGFLSPAMAAIIKSRIDQKIDSGEIDLTRAPQPVIDLYEEEREDWGERNAVRTSTWNELSTDEKAIYLDNIKRNTIEERNNAFDILADYRDAKKSKVAPRGASFYETNRAAYNKDLPAWVDLNNTEREAFLKAIEPGLGAPTAKPKVSTEQMDAGFKAVVEQVNKRLEEKAGKETAKAEEQKVKSQRLNKEEEAAAKEEVEVGKELPPLVKMMLGEGGINSVLAYIARKAGGVLFNRRVTDQYVENKKLRDRLTAAERLYEKRYGALSRAIFKNVAAALNTINFSKSQVVVDPNNAIIKQLQREGKLAAYDPKTDTFYFTRDGMDEMTVLHEIVHAGTIKILYAYKTNPNSLTREQREAAEQINKVYEFAKKKLEGKYPNQLENVYEFVSYALTDPRFQEELSQIQAPSLAKFTLPPSGAASGFNLQSLWSHLTKAMMRLYGLTKAATRFFEIKPELYNEAARAFGGEKYTKEKLAIDKSVLREVKNYLAVEETEDGKRDIDPGTRLTFESVSGLREAVQDRLEDNYPEAFSDTTDQGVVDFIEKYLSDKNFAEQVDKTSADVYKQAKIGITKKAGFQGNALIEVTQAFQNILAAPEAGIDIEALPAKKPKQAKPAKQAPAEGKADFDAMVAAMPSQSGNVRQAVRKMGWTKTSESLVKLFQNDRAAIKNWQNRLRYTGRLIAYATGFNNIYDQLTLSSGNAFHLYTEYAQKHSDALRQEILAYAKKNNLDTDRALNELGLFAIALHEPERRRTLYLRTVPLESTIATLTDAKGNSITPAAARDAIFAYLDSHKLDESGAKYLRSQLDKIVDDSANHDRKAPAEKFDINNQAYSVAGYTTEQIEAAKKAYESRKTEVEPILHQMKALNKTVLELNRMANYMSAYADNYIMFYGYDNYVPFKGKTFNQDKADMFNFDTRKIGGELQEQQHTFEGRITPPDNPVLQVMSDAAQAALRAGRRDVTQAIYNAVKDGTLAGKPMSFGEGANKRDYITFEERNQQDILEKLKGENKVFHYMADGRIAVIEISDKAQREAIRRNYREVNPLTDWLITKGNLLTGVVGQMHTRYNVAFAPINFVRDVLTNSFTLGAELGPKATFQYLGAVASDVATGNLYKTGNFARLYANGNVAAIESLAKSDKTGYYRDLLDYIKIGGKVSYIQGIAPKGQYNELFKGVGGNKILRTKEQVDKFFDMYIDTFELAARVSAYRITKATETARLKKEDPTKSAAEIDKAASKTAAAYAKNLANFEQVGQYGRALGAFFMFFRPSATGAVRALEAIAPLARSVQTAKLSLPEFAEAANIREQLSKGVSAAEKKALEAKLAKLDKAVAMFEENYSQRRKNAQAMTAVLTGVGVAAYLMSLAMADDDDLGRNKAAIDDMSRWTRYGRFFIPGTNTIIQIPWGYGLGAFAAAGAQAAAMFNGNVRMVDTLGNLMTISLDSFLPLPISRIPPTEKPLPFLIDSMVPSVARPLVEYVINVDALGRQIYNNRQSRFGDAYTGGDNIPELYKNTAISILEIFGADISPNTLYFFANNYADGASRLLHNANNTRLWLSGKKDFEAKTDLMVFDSFFGRQSNFDAREWQRVEDQLKDRSARIKMLKENNPAEYAKYVAKNPLDTYLSDMYNSEVNGRLRDLRAQANKIRAMSSIDPKTRTEIVKNIVLQENLEKRRMINVFKALGVEP